MNDVPAQFRLNGLLWLTALVGFLCAIARAVPIDEFRVLIVILVLMFAPLVLYWEWKDVKRSEYGIGCDIAEPDERARPDDCR